MRTRHRLFASAALTLTMGIGAGPDARADLPPIPFEKYTLDNGLTVILSPDKRLPLVAVDVWYHVGPVQEAKNRTGFAHLFEHLMFQGSQHVGDDQHFAILEAAGASSLNGTTDYDRTNYFESVPSNQLELALWLESDRMGFLLPAMTQAKLDNQRDVVQNERRQSIENVPYGLAEEKIYQTLFPPGHPYYGYVIGSHADLQAARLEDVVDFFQKYYAPGNASLSICGDFKPAEVKKLVQKYFGSIPKGPGVPAATPPATPVISKEVRVKLTDNVQLPRLYMAWLSPKIYQPGDAEADLFGKVLGGGKSSRLYERLVYDKKIAQDVMAFQYSLILGSVFTVQVTAKPGVTLAAIEKEVQAVLDDTRKVPVTAEELDRAKRSFAAGFLRAMEGIGGFGGKADRLNQYEHYLQDPGWVKKDYARYQAATAEALMGFAQQYLGSKQRVVIEVIPPGAAKPKAPAPLKPTKPTKSGTAKPASGSKTTGGK